MDWVQSLNEAIDFIEGNLLVELTCDQIAEHIFISNFHFQRTFSLLTNQTVGEYIRKRRLSLAGHELTNENVKVIDIALKYGYETPESFSKAFTRFHGISPIQAKKQGSNLKSFNRLFIKIRLEGGSVMDYKIVKKDDFCLVGMQRTFDENTCKENIPLFWSEYLSKGWQNKVCPMMGICSQTKKGTTNFDYAIGCEEKFISEVPEGFIKIQIPEYAWAIFKCVGPMPHTIQQMWGRIYSEWLPQARYELIPDYDIEFYTQGDTSSENYVSEIWIPVKEK